MGFTADAASAVGRAHLHSTLITPHRIRGTEAQFVKECCGCLAMLPTDFRTAKEWYNWYGARHTTLALRACAADEGWDSMYFLPAQQG